MNSTPFLFFDSTVWVRLAVFLISVFLSVLVHLAMVTGTSGALTMFLRSPQLEETAHVLLCPSSIYLLYCLHWKPQATLMKMLTLTQKPWQRRKGMRVSTRVLGGGSAGEVLIAPLPEEPGNVAP